MSDPDMPRIPVSSIKKAEAQALYDALALPGAVATATYLFPVAGGQSPAAAAAAQQSSTPADGTSPGSAPEGSGAPPSPPPPPSLQQQFSSVAPFSSVGPTRDGRIKPDIMAPGGWKIVGGPLVCRRLGLHSSLLVKVRPGVSPNSARAPAGPCHTSQPCISKRMLLALTLLHAPAPHAPPPAGTMLLSAIPGRPGQAPGPGGCNTGRLSGTSMATPVVAGSAAILRQYFSEGFYPSGALSVYICRMVAAPRMVHAC